MSKRRIYLVHGFNVRDDGKGSTDTLRQPLEKAGYQVTELDYGLFGRVRVRLCNQGVAKMMAEAAVPGSVLIAHSNGCALAYMAAKYGGEYNHAFLINPALDDERAIPNVPKVTVFYSPSDPWTRLSKFIPWSIWGSQGRDGYTGNDEEGRYTQYDMDALTGQKMGHSGIFKTAERRALILDLIITALEKGEST